VSATVPFAPEPVESGRCHGQYHVGQDEEDDEVPFAKLISTRRKMPALKPLSKCIWMVLIAFAVRLSFMLIFSTYTFTGVDDFTQTGEATRIAASIARGNGFSSPFGDEYTGPTAWIAPVYPYFIALVFHCFGIFSQTSTIIIFTVQGWFSALTIIPILGIADRTVGKRAGLLAGWIWILFPWFGKWAVTWEWEISLSALLLSLIFWYTLRLEKPATLKSWMTFGALEGFALLVNPALSAIVPVTLAWHVYKLRFQRREWLKPAAAMLACLIVMSPWIVRNRIVFGQWVFLRGNFGFEFALGNYHNSFGRGWGGFHPGGSLREYADYKQKGEMVYIHSKQKLALQFVRNYPGEFISLTAKRVAYFWDGSAIGYRPPIARHWVPSSFGALSFLLLPALLVAHRQGLHAWQAFFGALFVYPMPYYLTFSQSRYRHAIEPLILLLLAYALVEACDQAYASMIRAADHFSSTRTRMKTRVVTHTSKQPAQGSDI